MRSSGFEAVIPGTMRTCSTPSSTNRLQNTSSSCTARNSTHSGMVFSALLAAKLTP